MKTEPLVGATLSDIVLPPAVPLIFYKEERRPTNLPFSI